LNILNDETGLKPDFFAEKFRQYGKVDVQRCKAVKPPAKEVDSLDETIAQLNSFIEHPVVIGPE
jgi:hypothetical protein